MEAPLLPRGGGEVKRAAGLDDVEFIVVSDGSTDRTVEIVRTFADVKLIVFERTAATGGHQGRLPPGTRSLVGFMDATERAIHAGSANCAAGRSPISPMGARFAAGPGLAMLACGGWATAYSP